MSIVESNLRPDVSKGICLRSAERTRTSGFQWILKWSIFKHSKETICCGNKLLFTFANDMRRGEWGPSNYKKAIEIYTSFIDQKNEKYADDSLFWLAAMHLKGKCDDDQNAQNIEPMLRKENLSNIAAADACAKKFELSNPSLYKKYLEKKVKYLNVYSGW